jgi:hypothetical protein
MKSHLTPIMAAVAALVGTAAELHAVGAVRPEHAERFSAFRTGLDQLSGLAAAALTAADEATPRPPGSAEFDQVREQLAAVVDRVEGLAMTVDHTGDQVQQLVDLANAPAAPVEA